MTSNTNKLLVGALLAGMGIITGEATLIATAGGVGVNWLAEGLAGLWPALGGKPSDPLAKAYAAAIRDAVDALQDDYRRTIDPRSDRAAFRLVAECADTVAGVEFPPGTTDVDAAQRALEAGLAALLHGHDQREAAYLREHLMMTCAAAFQRRLVQDETAWRAFHGLVLQALAANSAVLLSRLERFVDVLASWSNPQSSLDQLKRLEAQLADLSARPAIAPPLRFDNRGLQVGGSIYQSARDQYLYSAHAQGGGTATATNIIGALAHDRPEVPSLRSSPHAKILFLAANPVDTPRLRLDQEARRVDESLRQGRNGERVHLSQQWAVRSEDLLDALLRHRPAIVHFAGHGGSDGSLFLEDASGRAAPIAPSVVVSLLAAPSSVRCAVLNACWTDALACALLNVTACVVGMTADVPDATAIAFAAGFYRVLADGESVAAAVAAGRAEAAAAGAEEAAAAVQLRAADGVDPSAMRFP